MENITCWKSLHLTCRLFHVNLFTSLLLLILLPIKIGILSHLRQVLSFLHETVVFFTGLNGVENGLLFFASSHPLSFGRQVQLVRYVNQSIS